MVFTDSDVHKTVEAMSIALEIDPQGDQEIIAGQEWIRNKLEEWVPIIVKAQIPDGDQTQATSTHGMNYHVTAVDKSGPTIPTMNFM